MMRNSATERLLGRKAEEEGFEEAFSEERNYLSPHEVWALQQTQNFICEPQFSTEGIEREAQMLNDGETKADTEQEGESGDHTAQWAGKVEGLEHGSSEVNGKERQGSAVASALQESSTGEEGVQTDEPGLLPYDFFSTGETTQLANYLHRQAEEIGERFRHYSSLMQGTKPSICSRTKLSIEEVDEFASKRGHDLPTMPQSKMVSRPSQGKPDHLACLDLSLKLPHSFNAVGDGDSGATQSKSSGNVMNGVWNPPLKLTPRVHSEDLCRIVSRPRSTTLSAGFSGFREIDDRKWHESIFGGLHLSQENCSQESDASRHEHGLGVVEHRECSRGISWRHAVKKSSSSPSSTNTSAHFLADNPGTLSLALPQTYAMEVHSDVEHAQNCFPEQGGENIRDVGSQVTPPPSASCVDSSECDNFGAEIATGNAANEPNLIYGRSRYRSEEVDAMSEAGGLEKCKEEDAILPLGVDTAEAPTEIKSGGYGALDLLVSAIQVTSGGFFGEEDDGVPGPSEKIETEIEAGHDVECGSEEAYFVHGRSPIVKKRVLRRAKSAFKKNQSVDSVKYVLRFEVSEVPSGSKKRKRHVSEEKQEVQDAENDATFNISEAALVKDGDPVIRSKRGRSQVLPTKFSDSVLQPWKRKSRRKRKGKLEIP